MNTYQISQENKYNEMQTMKSILRNSNYSPLGKMNTVTQKHNKNNRKTQYDQQNKNGLPSHT
jgi:hypothetical protein